MRSRWSKTLTAGCALLALMATPMVATAQDAPTETRRSAVDDDGPQVRRTLLYLCLSLFWRSRVGHRLVVGSRSMTQTRIESTP